VRVVTQDVSEFRDKRYRFTKCDMVSIHTISSGTAPLDPAGTTSGRDRRPARRVDVASATGRGTVLPGTDTDGDGDREHSAVHAGELQWGTDPTAGGDTPPPSVLVAIDYHNSRRGRRSR
jgi:hypothetical protein